MSTLVENCWPILINVGPNLKIFSFNHLARAFLLWTFLPSVIPPAYYHPTVQILIKILTVITNDCDAKITLYCYLVRLQGSYSCMTSIKNNPLAFLTLPDNSFNLHGYMHNHRWVKLAIKGSNSIRWHLHGGQNNFFNLSSFQILWK